MYGYGHPFVVHFPIAFLLAAAVLGVLRLWWRDAAELRFSHIASFFAGMAGVMLAVVTGMLAQDAAADTAAEQYIATHSNLAYVVVVAYFATFLVHMKKEKELSPPVKAALALAYAAAALLLLWTGMLGGELVYLHRVGLQ